MVRRVRFTLAALAELDTLQSDIAARAPDRAPDYVQELKIAIVAVAKNSFPLAVTKARPDLGRNLRSFNFGTSKRHQRAIVVEVTEDFLIVIRILHGSMDQPARMTDSQR